jgi:hypothetical protein
MPLRQDIVTTRIKSTGTATSPQKKNIKRQSAGDATRLMSFEPDNNVGIDFVRI